MVTTMILFMCVLIAFVALGSVSSVLSYKRLASKNVQNDLFWVEWDDQSVNATFDIFADFYITNCRRLIFYLDAPLRNNPVKCM